MEKESFMYRSDILGYFIQLTIWMYVDIVEEIKNAKERPEQGVPTERWKFYVPTPHRVIVDGDTKIYGTLEELEKGL